MMLYVSLLTTHKYYLSLSLSFSLLSMEDAVQLFSSICSNSLLRDCNIILFLNKTDLFERKLKDSPVQKYFADYGKFLR